MRHDDGTKGSGASGGIAIIGNCPLFVDTQGRTDRYRRVVRFNNTSGFGSSSGSTISDLVLVSRGGQAIEWLADPAFAERPAIRQAVQITLVFPPTDDPGAQCRARELTAMLVRIGKRVRHIEQRVHDEARLALVARGGPPDAALSSGFVYAFQTLLERAPDAPPVDIFGFSFEGWAGHAWHAEKRWFEENRDGGRLIIHPPGEENSSP